MTFFSLSRRKRPIVVRSRDVLHKHLNFIITAFVFRFPFLAINARKVAQDSLR